MAKEKLTPEQRLIRRLQRKLEEARTREELLGYLAETVLRHFFVADAAIDEWIKIAGGVRARKMMRALKVLFRYPGRGSVGKRLRDALSAQFFARKLDERKKLLKQQPKPPLGLLDKRSRTAGVGNRRGGWETRSRGQAGHSSRRQPARAD